MVKKKKNKPIDSEADDISRIIGIPIEEAEKIKDQAHQIIATGELPKGWIQLKKPIREFGFSEKDQKEIEKMKLEDYKMLLYSILQEIQSDLKNTYSPDVRSSSKMLLSHFKYESRIEDLEKFMEFLSYESKQIAKLEQEEI